MQQVLLWAARIQVWLLVLCLSAGRIVNVTVGGVHLSLGGDAYKLVPLLALTWGGWRYSLKQPRSWRMATVLPPWLLLVGVALAGTVFAVDPESALREGLKLGLCVLLFVVLVDLPWNWRTLGATLVAFLAGNLWNLVLIYRQHQAGLQRVSGSFDHPNILGSFCLLALGVLAFALFVERRWYVRLLTALVLTGIIVAIYWTGSRSTYLGLLAFMVTILLIGSRRELICTSLLLAVLLVFAANSERIQDRLRHTGNELRVAAGMDRPTVWSLSLAMLREQPRGLGIGLGDSFNTLAQTMPGVATDPDLRRVAHAHNLYLHLLLVLGPAGLFAFCWAMFSMYVHVLHPAMQEYSGAYTSSPFLVAGLVGLLVQQLFDVSLLKQNNLPALMVYLGMATLLLVVRRVPARATATAGRSAPATARSNDVPGEALCAS